MEAKIYYTLTQKGISKVKTISMNSKISRPDVYRTLYRLSKLGLIEKIISTPSTYQAIALDKTVQILIERKNVQLELVKSKSEKFIEKMRKNHKKPKNIIESNFVLIPSKETIIKKLKVAIDNSKKSIEVITTINRFELACHFLSDSLNQAWNRNVKGRAIIQKLNKNQKNKSEGVWKKPNAELRYIKSIPSNIISIYDRKQAFVFTESAYSDLKGSPALWSNNEKLISLAVYYFNSMWEKAIL